MLDVLAHAAAMHDRKGRSGGVAQAMLKMSDIEAAHENAQDTDNFLVTK
jgi:hypothetical protein